jgi:hypothetical protein
MENGGGLGLALSAALAGVLFSRLGRRRERPR